MKISMLMENTAFANGFATEHGLSLYLETDKHRILYDMGQSGSFVANAVRLGVDLAAVDVAVLSHGHYDHGGGLEAFFAVNQHAPVYMNQYAFDECRASSDRYIGINMELAQNPRLRFVGEHLAIDEQLELFACNDRPRPFVMDSYGLNVIREDQLIPDDFRHEQYLLIHEQGKRILISGCSHKGILNIMNWFEPDGLIGGFHFMKIDPTGSEQTVLDDAVQGLQKYCTQYYTCHCTGLPQYEYLQTRMGNQLRYLAAGQQIDL